ncbi:hypothetical protein C4Q26_14330 [Pseudomonas sp. SWI44]|nr:hypothetical protein C4Q26_14330 [Pseudomonas sp. SWI44]
MSHRTVEQSHAQVRGRNLAYLSMAIFSGQFLRSSIELIPSGNYTLIFGCSCALACADAIRLSCRSANRRQHHCAS